MPATFRPLESSIKFTGNLKMAKNRLNYDIEHSFCFIAMWNIFFDQKKLHKGLYVFFKPTKFFLRFPDTFRPFKSSANSINSPKIALIQAKLSCWIRILAGLSRSLKSLYTLLFTIFAHVKTIFCTKYILYDINSLSRI